jgi:nucleoid DNA-binding protein
MKKHEMIEQIQNNNLGSIYSKDDVIRLLESIESEKTVATVNDKIIRNITEGIMNLLERMDSVELVDFGSASFSLDYSNTVELESIDTQIELDKESIRYIVTEAFKIEDDKNDEDTE